MRFLKFFDWITNCAAVIGVCGIPLLIAIMVFEVFSRYVLNAPTIWAFELSWMLMGLIFIMGVAYALKRREHVTVDLIYASLSSRTRAAIDAVGFLLLLPWVVWVAYMMLKYSMAGYISGEVSGVSAWNPVLWPFRATLTLGLGVFTLQLIAEIIRALHRAIRGASEEPAPR